MDQLIRKIARSVNQIATKRNLHDTIHLAVLRTNSPYDIFCKARGINPDNEIECYQTIIAEKTGDDNPNTARGAFSPAAFFDSLKNHDENCRRVFSEGFSSALTPQTVAKALNDQNEEVPSRVLLLHFSVVFQFTARECDELLKAFSYQPLYPKSAFDMAIYVVLKEGERLRGEGDAETNKSFYKRSFDAIFDLLHEAAQGYGNKQIRNLRALGIGSILNTTKISDYWSRHMTINNYSEYIASNLQLFKLEHTKLLLEYKRLISVLLHLFRSGTRYSWCTAGKDEGQNEETDVTVESFAFIDFLAKYFKKNRRTFTQNRYVNPYYIDAFSIDHETPSRHFMILLWIYEYALARTEIEGLNDATVLATVVNSNDPDQLLRGYHEAAFFASSLKTIRSYLDDTYKIREKSWIGEQTENGREIDLSKERCVDLINCLNNLENFRNEYRQKMRDVENQNSLKDKYDSITQTHQTEYDYRIESYLKKYHNAISNIQREEDILIRARNRKTRMNPPESWAFTQSEPRLNSLVSEMPWIGVNISYLLSEETLCSFLPWNGADFITFINNKLSTYHLGALNANSVFDSYVMGMGKINITRPLGDQYYWNKVSMDLGDHNVLFCDEMKRILGVSDTHLMEVPFRLLLVHAYFASLSKRLNPLHDDSLIFDINLSE